MEVFLSSYSSILPTDSSKYFKKDHFGSRFSVADPDNLNRPTKWVESDRIRNTVQVSNNFGSTSSTTLHSEEKLVWI